MVFMESILFQRNGSFALRLRVRFVLFAEEKIQTSSLRLYSYEVRFSANQSAPILI